MKTVFRRCLPPLLCIALLLCYQVAALGAEVTPAPSKLSPANAVFNLKPEGLKMLWRAELGDISDTRLKSLYPAGLWLVAESPEGEVHVLDARNGRWKTVRLLRHGLGSAPTAVGDTLWLISHNHLYRLDLKTADFGAVYHPRFAASAPPLFMEADLVLAGSNGHIASFTREDFERNWRVSLTGPIAEQPVLMRSKLFAAASEVIGLGADEGRALWRWEPKEPARLTTGLAVSQGEVFVGDNLGRLYGLGMDYGDLRWEASLGAPLVGKPHVIGGKLLVFTNEPEAVCLNISGERDVAWHLEGATRLLTTGDGTVYLLTEGHEVAAISLKSGRELWREPLPAGCIAAGHKDAPIFYVGSPDGTVVAFQELD